MGKVLGYLALWEANCSFSLLGVGSLLVSTVVGLLGCFGERLLCYSTLYSGLVLGVRMDEVHCEVPDRVEMSLME